MKMRHVVDLSKGVLGRGDSIDLWTEILSHIPDSFLLKPDIKILSVACGHCTEAVILAKRMIALGIDKEKVNNSIWLIDKYSMFTNAAGMIYGFKNVVTEDFLTWDPGMKFDVIIGNPPYQRSDNGSHKLWPDFVKTAISLISPSGYILLVTPNAWVYNPTSQKFKSVVTALLTGNLISASLSLTEKYFSTINEDIGYWVWQNCCYSNSTKFKRDAIEKDIIWDGQIVTFTVDEEIKQSINYKFLHKAENKFKFYVDVTSDKNTKDLIKDNVITDLSDSEHSAELFWSGSQRKFINEKSVRPGWKVIINRSGYYFDAANPNKYLTYSNRLGVGQLAIGIACQDEYECSNMLSYLTSKLYIWYMQANKTNGFNEHFRKVPKLSNKKWTDLALYEYFDLSQEEIDYIETTIK